MAKGLGGLLATGQETKKQAMSGLLSSARAETQKTIAEEQLKQQKEIAQSQTEGTLAGTGAAIGFAVGGPAGAAVGAAIGFLTGKLFG